MDVDPNVLTCALSSYCGHGTFYDTPGKRIKEEFIMGNSHYEERNNSGEKLVSFAMISQVKIAHTFFQKSNKKKWISPNGPKSNCLRRG